MTEPEPPAGPRVDVPFKEALNGLTGFEAIGVQKHYGADLEKLGGVRSMCGTVWAYENRREKVSWQVVEAMTLAQLKGYFAEEDPDPDSEQGKESSGSAPTRDG